MSRYLWFGLHCRFHLFTWMTVETRMQLKTLYLQALSPVALHNFSVYSHTDELYNSFFLLSNSSYYDRKCWSIKRNIPSSSPFWCIRTDCRSLSRDNFFHASYYWLYWLFLLLGVYYEMEIVPIKSFCGNKWKHDNMFRYVMAVMLSCAILQLI